jgi:hypothetical protein
MVLSLREPIKPQSVTLVARHRDHHERDRRDQDRRCEREHGLQHQTDQEELHNRAHARDEDRSAEAEIERQVELGEPDLALRRLKRAEALATKQRHGLVLEPQLLRGAALILQG